MRKQYQNTWSNLKIAGTKTGWHIMNGDKPESDDIKTAEDLLDAISETWADRTGIVGQLKSILKEDKTSGRS